MQNAFEMLFDLKHSDMRFLARRRRNIFDDIFGVWKNVVYENFNI